MSIVDGRELIKSKQGSVRFGSGLRDFKRKLLMSFYFYRLFRLFLAGDNFLQILPCWHTPWTYRWNFAIRQSFWFTTEGFYLEFNAIFCDYLNFFNHASMIMARNNFIARKVLFLKGELGDDLKGVSPATIEEVNEISIW